MRCVRAPQRCAPCRAAEAPVSIKVPWRCSTLAATWAAGEGCRQHGGGVRREAALPGHTDERRLRVRAPHGVRRVKHGRILGFAACPRASSAEQRIEPRVAAPRHARQAKRCQLAQPDPPTAAKPGCCAPARRGRPARNRCLPVGSKCKELRGQRRAHHWIHHHVLMVPSARLEVHAHHSPPCRAELRAHGLTQGPRTTQHHCRLCDCACHGWRTVRACSSTRRMRIRHNK